MAESGKGSYFLEKPDENTDELIQVSKPVVNILCYGSNDFKCSKLKSELSEERVRELPYELSLHYAQDIDLVKRLVISSTLCG